MKIVEKSPISFSQVKLGECFYPVGNSKVLYLKMPVFYEKNLGPINAVNLEVMGYTTFDDDHHVFPVETEIHIL